MSTVQTPNNNTDPFPATVTDKSSASDLTVYGSPVTLRPIGRNAVRRCSGKTGTDEQTDDNQLPAAAAARLHRSDARRGSSFVKTMSEDLIEDNKLLGRSSLKPDIRRGSSFIRTCDDSLEEACYRKLELRRGSSLAAAAAAGVRAADELNVVDDNNQCGGGGRVRRGSSFIRMISEDINNEEMLSTGRLSSSRRTSSVTDEDSWSRRSSRSSDYMRRGSSLVKVISEENDELLEDNQTINNTNNKLNENSSLEQEKVRKSLDNNSYRHSLESINENKTQTFPSLNPSIEYSSASIESPVSDLSSDFAQKSSTESNKDTSTDKTYMNSSLSYMSWIESVNNSFGNAPASTITIAPDNESIRSGEWNSFWSNYNNSTATRNEFSYSSPYLCPSNSGEDLSYESNESVNRNNGNKTQLGSVVLTADEINEALYCSQRILDILRAAIKRSNVTDAELPSNQSNNIRAKDEEKPINSADVNGKERTFFKPTANSCIDAILNHTGVADILKRVINKRRDVLMPSEESSSSECSFNKK